MLAKQDRAPNKNHTVISTTNLTKQFGKRYAVRDLSMEIPSGRIVGFVGPNGAGKTTTIRMLLGLIRPTSGAGSVLGAPIAEPARYLDRVGALIETPAFYPTLSGEENLRVLSSLGGIPRHRIGTVLETVGLTGRERDKVGTYSLGMKQRLGVAAALLPDPDLLILDEPTNGLDPEGIIEMRDLLRDLWDAGTTIFVSSHLLGELERIADWLIVIKAGQAVYSGPTGDLARSGRSGFVLATESSHMNALTEVVEHLGFHASSQDGHLRVEAPADAAAAISRRALQAGIPLTEIRPVRATLEDQVLAMIAGESQDSSNE
jgi:ABC-2 type transport system ATP-binding protein